MKILRVFARTGIVAALLLLAACAITPSKIEPTSLGRIKTVGVISAVGDSLSYKEIAIMVFGNDLVEQPAAEYGIDPYVIGEVTKELSGHYRVQPVTYDVGDFLPNKVTVANSQGMFDDGDPIGTVIRNKVKPNDLDAYVVVLKADSGVFNTNQSVRGFGLIRRAMAFYHMYWAHATYYVAVIDGHTGKVLSGAGAADRAHPFSLFDGPYVAGPYKDADETYWPDDLKNIPPAKVKLLADTLDALVTASMPDALREMKLLP
jgi:hypothetical protein